MLILPPLNSETELLTRCQTIEGLSLAQLAGNLNVYLPTHPLQRKGWAGQMIERVLGTTAGTKASPDFHELGIELKTLPINHQGKPAESTFVTRIALLTIHQESWEESSCYAKLKRVLWIPIEADKAIPFPDRRIGRATLWSPNAEQWAILKSDWTEYAELIGSGKLAEVNAALGSYLQVRPKAANSKALCYGYDEEGNKVLTMPRGFYLRSSFTTTVI